jgi:hypothetical protein
VFSVIIPVFVNPTTKCCCLILILPLQKQEDQHLISLIYFVGDCKNPMRTNDKEICLSATDVTNAVALKTLNSHENGKTAQKVHGPV